MHPGRVLARACHILELDSPNAFLAPLRGAEFFPSLPGVSACLNLRQPSRLPAPTLIGPQKSARLAKMAMAKPDSSRQLLRFPPPVNGRTFSSRSVSSEAVSIVPVRIAFGPLTILALVMANAQEPIQPPELYRAKTGKPFIQVAFSAR